MGARGLAVVLAFLPLAACRITEDFRDPAYTELMGARPLPVTLSPELRGLRERVFIANERVNYKIYSPLRVLFPASDGSAFLSLVESELEPSTLAPWKARYSLTVDLQHGGSIQRFSASADYESREGPRQAACKAIADVLLDVYHQVDRQLAL